MARYYHSEFIKSKDNRPFCWWAYNDLYEINIYLVQGQEKKMIQTWPNIERGSENSGYCFLNNDNQPVIWLPKRTEPCVFAHECVHVVSEIMKAKGIDYDVDNDEPIAYLHSWLFNVFFKRVKFD